MVGSMVWFGLVWLDGWYGTVGVSWVGLSNRPITESVFWIVTLSCYMFEIQLS